MALDDREVDRLRAAVSDATFDARFELVAEAGKGGMGRVYEAIDRETDQRVAVKVVANLADRTRFTAEAEILEQLDHPAIVKYVRHGITRDGDPYLAMAWLVGEPLSKRLARSALAIPEACTLGERIASALEHAHAAGIVHRDIKPSNVILVGDSVEGTCVIDFGIAKTAERDLTHTGQLIGTPGYMAPEQVRGDKDVDRRVDLFALGCVLYESLALKAPFDGAEVMEVLARLLLEQPPAIETLVPAVPPRLGRLIAALLVKSAAYRLADARIVREELAAIRIALATDDREALAMRSPAVPDVDPEAPTAVTAPARPVAPVANTPAPRPRRRWPLAVAAGGALAIVAGVGFALMRTPAVECNKDLPDTCRIACEAGDGDACHAWGQAQYTGHRGATKNRSAAIESYARGCELGSTRACVSGASAQLRDQPTELAAVARAEHMLGYACDRGSSDACRHLGIEYLPGRAFADDAARALRYLAKSCDGNVRSGCVELKRALDAGLGDSESRAIAKASHDAACARKQC